MAQSATCRVLANAELLELILSCLSYTDLLLGVKATCRHFHSVIETSPKLQRKLFRLPALDPTAPIFAFPVHIPGLLITPYMQILRRDPLDSPSKPITKHYTIELSIGRDFDLQLNPSDSLRSSYVCQPPVHCFPRHHHTWGHELDWHIDDSVRVSEIVEPLTRWRPEGITFGNIFDFLEENSLQLIMMNVTGITLDSGSDVEKGRTAMIIRLVENCPARRIPGRRQSDPEPKNIFT